MNDLLPSIGADAERANGSRDEDVQAATLVAAEEENLAACEFLFAAALG